MYPPVPITTSGLNSSIIFFAWPIPFKCFNHIFTFSILIFLLNPCAVIVFSS